MNIEEKLRGLDRNMALQGELIGEGIQGNKYRIRGQTVWFFDAFDINRHECLNFAGFTALLDELSLEAVPVLNTD